MLLQFVLVFTDANHSPCQGVWAWDQLYSAQFYKQNFLGTHPWTLPYYCFSFHSPTAQVGPFDMPMWTAITSLEISMAWTYSGKVLSTKHKCTLMREWNVFLLVCQTWSHCGVNTGLNIIEHIRIILNLENPCSFLPHAGIPFVATIFGWKTVSTRVKGCNLIARILLFKH